MFMNSYLLYCSYKYRNDAHFDGCKHADILFCALPNESSSQRSNGITFRLKILFYFYNIPPPLLRLRFLVFNFFFVCIVYLWLCVTCCLSLTLRYMLPSSYRLRCDQPVDRCWENMAYITGAGVIHSVYGPDCGLDIRGIMVRIPVRVGGFNFLRSVSEPSRAHHTSCSVVTWGFFALPVSTQSGRETDSSLLSNPEVLMYRNILQLLRATSWRAQA